MSRGNEDLIKHHLNQAIDLMVTDKKTVYELDYRLDYGPIVEGDRVAKTVSGDLTINFNLPRLLSIIVERI